MTDQVEGYTYLTKEDFAKLVEEMKKNVKYEYSEDQREKCLAFHHFLRLSREGVLEFAKKFNLETEGEDYPMISVGTDSEWKFDPDTDEVISWTMPCATIITNLVPEVLNVQV